MENTKKINSFKDLIVWQKGMLILKLTYTITSKLPQSEMFGLASQLRRCALSIPSNISEGQGRGTRKDFANFLHIALGSLSELETQILFLESEYKNISIGNILTEIEEERKMLSSMIKKLKQ